MVTATDVPLCTAAPLAASSAVVCPPFHAGHQFVETGTQVGVLQLALIRNGRSLVVSNGPRRCAGMDSEVSFKLLTVAWISPVLSDVALGLGVGVGISVPSAFGLAWTATPMPGVFGGAGVDVAAQAADTNNINPDKPSCRATAARFQILLMASGSLHCLVDFT